jgi:hypothetical protein
MRRRVGLPMMSAEITVCLNAADGSPGRQLEAQGWWDHKIGSCPVTRQRDAADHRDAQQRLDVRVMRMRFKRIPQDDQQVDLPRSGRRARPRFLPEVTEDFRLWPEYRRRCSLGVRTSWGFVPVRR